jgi:hypothetical protein
MLAIADVRNETLFVDLTAPTDRRIGERQLRSYP